jgi:hypothetical protein
MVWLVELMMMSQPTAAVEVEASSVAERADDEKKNEMNRSFLYTSNFLIPNLTT